MAENKGTKTSSSKSEKGAVDKEVPKKDTPKKGTPKKSTATKKKYKAPKPYVHIDTFLKTAVPYFNLTNVQASGFRSRMNGRHYQRDEQVFVDELKKYLNIK